MLRRSQHEPRILKPAFMFALGLLVLLPRHAAASPITWEYSMLVHGTATSLPTNQLIAIPVGTPMVVTVTFDTDTPNICGPGAAVGFYYLPNSATVDFLGYRYSASVGLELNVVYNSCTPYNGGGVRVFVGSPLAQLDPNGTQVQWLGFFGNLFLPGPPREWMGSAWPDSLPDDGALWSGIPSTLSGSQPALQFESVVLRPVPEPSTWLLLGTGLVTVVARRRLKRRS